MEVTSSGKAPAFAAVRAYGIKPFGNGSLQTSFSLEKTDKSAEADSLEAAVVDVRARKDYSGVRGILSSIQQVTNRLQEIDEGLKSSFLTEDQRTALQSEQGALSAEYDRIIQGKDYQRFIEVSQSIQGILSSGGDPKALYKALRSERSVLGEDYLNLVGSYATSNIATVNNAFTRIGGITGDALVKDPSLARSVSDLVNTADTALTIPRLSSEAPIIKKEEAAKVTTELPQQSELQFVFSNEIAMSLQGYAGKDLLQAAVSGMDPSTISQLVLHPPKDLEDESNQRSSMSDENQG